MVTPAQFAQALLHRIGLPVTSNNVAALVAAQAIEGGFMANGAAYNPLNTTWKSTNSRAITPVGVQAYVNWEQGLDATARTLTNGLYKGILSALAADSPPDVTLTAMAFSPWGWYHLDDNGKRVQNPVGRALGYQFYANKVFPPGPAGDSSLNIAVKKITIGVVAALALLGAAAFYVYKKNS